MQRSGALAVDWSRRTEPRPAKWDNWMRTVPKAPSWFSEWLGKSVSAEGDHDKESTKTNKGNDGRKKSRIDSGYTSAGEYEPA